MMAMRILIKHVLRRTEPAELLQVAGWVRTRRDSKTFSFLELNDGSCLGNLQIVADAGIPGYEDITKMATGASIEVKGKLVPSPSAGRSWEMQATSIKLLGEVPDDNPLQKKGHSPARCSGYAAGWRMRCTGFSKSEISSMSTRPSSRPAIARARVKCSASPPCQMRGSRRMRRIFPASALSSR